MCAEPFMLPTPITPLESHEPCTIIRKVSCLQVRGSRHHGLGCWEVLSLAFLALMCHRLHKTSPRGHYRITGVSWLSNPSQTQSMVSPLLPLGLSEREESAGGKREEVTVLGSVLFWSLFCSLLWLAQSQKTEIKAVIAFQV